MARKKNSAVKMLHSEADCREQFNIAALGPRYAELKDAVELWLRLARHDDFGKLDEWVKEEAFHFFKRIVLDARSHDGGFLRRMADVVELKSSMIFGFPDHDPSLRREAEPWRLWLIARYKIPVLTALVREPLYCSPEDPEPDCFRDPETIAVLQEQLISRFNVNIDAHKLRSELRAMGVPYAQAKRGRRPTKPARKKRRS